MFRNFAIFSSLCIYFAVGVNPGPQTIPTKGEVWPKPQQQIKKNVFYTFSPSQFEIKTTNQTCTILSSAIVRYLNIIKGQHLVSRRSRRQGLASLRPRTRLQPRTSARYQGRLRQLQVELTQPCEDYPYLEMDERYTLLVSATSTLKSESVWGILRGLETFAQLFYFSDDYNELRINETEITDYPVYAHRGLLIDTSRHYLSLANILSTLDALAMNKMNVLHWHIIDDQSFPYKSEKFPELSEQGAFDASMVYTKSDIETVINYGRDRGIRVVPEIDVPGHTRSWGVAYPNILTKCYDASNVSTGLGPMHPLKPTTYKLLRDVLREAQDWFPDKYFHLGGDETDLQCWSSNPEIKSYMKEHNITNVRKMLAVFMGNALPMLTDKEPIVWQDAFDNGVVLPDRSLVHVWRTVATMIRVLVAKHRVLFSASWYLDVYVGRTFEQLYGDDPRQMVHQLLPLSLLQNIVGGEACMWGEMVDDRNLLSTVWPRGSAVAEVLWTSRPLSHLSLWEQLGGRLPEDVARRIEEHTCRMVRRGIPAQPATGPGFCLT